MHAKAEKCWFGHRPSVFQIMVILVTCSEVHISAGHVTGAVEVDQSNFGEEVFCLLSNWFGTELFPCTFRVLLQCFSRQLSVYSVCHTVEHCVKCWDG